MGIIPGSPLFPGGLLAGLELVVWIVLVACAVILIGCALLLWRAHRPAVGAAKGARMADESEAHRNREQFVGPRL